MKRAIAITFAVTGGVIVAMIILGVILTAAGVKTAGGGHATPASPVADPVTHTATPVARTHTVAAPVTATPPAVQPTRRVISVLFTVTGTGYPSITYGTDSDNLSPPGNLGPLGDGNALPWHGSLAYRSDALWYDVTAQLEGSGNIRCAVILKVTQYYSDGTHISRSKTGARGHASGSYNICSAQVSN